MKSNDLSLKPHNICFPVTAYKSSIVIYVAQFSLLTTFCLVWKSGSERIEHKVFIS